jgi:hypothetical protein
LQLDGRAKNFPSVRVLRLRIELPQLRSETALRRMQSRIAGHNGASEGRLGGVFHQFSPQRVFQDVIADSDKRVPSPLFFLGHMVVGLMLEFLWREKVSVKNGA